MKIKSYLQSTFILIAFFYSFFVSAQKRDTSQNYIPSEENLIAREWFKEAKFGLFIHWGVYSILGDGEWVMHNQKIAKDAYEKLPSFFNPIEFNAEEWVQIAKKAGMKYITTTSRHHDGFSMFDTKASDYNIVKKTPYKKDILKDLALACEKEGVKLFFYYSLLDWNRDDYFPRGKTGNEIAGRTKGNWNDYIAFMKAQLTELLTNYGPIGGIWFDGHWDKKDANWNYEEIYELIHKLQPSCLIGNNHHEGSKPGEDFQMFEKDLPGKNTTGWATPADDISKVLPLEVCETINGSWGFDLQDKKHKSAKELIRYLVNAAGYGSNFLLNVGPMPNGKIQPEHIVLLEKIGTWLKENGETIYASKAGPFPPTESRVSTMRNNKVFVHFLDSNKNTFSIPNKNLKIKSIVLFKTQKKIKHKVTPEEVVLSIPLEEMDDINTIVQINLKR